ncbi:MAG: YdcH family protein [Rhodobacteraceae bacterium]|nr:YdcH family protein [Paracoccaceae bacterium]
MTKRLSPGALGPRIAALRARHRRLDAMVHDEHARPLPDLVRLRRLKSDRLRLKDALSELEGALRTLDRGRHRIH